MEKREKFILWCDKAMAFSFYALIFFLPISIAFSESFTGAAFFFYLLKRGAIFYGYLKDKDQQPNNVIIFFRKLGKAYKPVPSILNIPIVFILIASLVSVLRSQYFILSIEGFVGKALQSAFLYFNFVECMYSRRRLKKFIVIFSVSCALVCINGLYQSIVGHGFIFGHIFSGRVSSSFRHANDFASYLLVMVPILFSLSFLTDSKKEKEEKGIDEFSFLFSLRMKMFCIILFIITVTCLGLTYSRGAWVGFVLSLLVMGLCTIRKYKIFIFHVLLISVFIFVFYPRMANERADIRDIHNFSTENNVVLSVGSDKASPLSLAKNDFFRYWKQSIRERTFIRDIKSSLAKNNRIIFWKRSILIVKDYPLFGCGLNTYALVSERYSVGWGGYPHNSYLQMAAETGLAGITVFLWMLFVLFRDSLGALRRIKIQQQQMLMFGFLTGLLGFLIHSFFDTNFYSVQLSSFMWIIMGVIVALPKIEKA